MSLFGVSQRQLTTQQSRTPIAADESTVQDGCFRHANRMNVKRLERELDEL